MLLQVLQAAQCLNLFQLQAQALIEQVPVFNFTANFSRSIRSLFALDFNSRCCWCFFNRFKLVLILMVQQAQVVQVPEQPLQMLE